MEASYSVSVNASALSHQPKILLNEAQLDPSASAQPIYAQQPMKRNAKTKWGSKSLHSFWGMSSSFKIQDCTLYTMGYYGLS